LYCPLFPFSFPSFSAPLDFFWSRSPRRLTRSIQSKNTPGTPRWMAGFIPNGPNLTIFGLVPSTRFPPSSGFFWKLFFLNVRTCIPSPVCANRALTFSTLPCRFPALVGLPCPHSLPHGLPLESNPTVNLHRLESLILQTLGRCLQGTLFFS